MSYMEIIQRALKNRSVYALAKQYGINQMTLNRYMKGDRLPDFATAKIIAMEAGISGSEMLDTLAEEEAKRRAKVEKISTSFKSLLRGAKRYWMQVPAMA